MANYLTAKDIEEAKELLAMIREQGRDGYFKKQKDGRYFVYVKGLGDSFTREQRHQRNERSIRYTNEKGEEVIIPRSQAGMRLEDIRQEDIDDTIAEEMNELSKSKSKNKKAEPPGETVGKYGRKTSEQIKKGLAGDQIFIQFLGEREASIAAERAKILGAERVDYGQVEGGWSVIITAPNAQEIKEKITKPPTEKEEALRIRKEAEARKRKQKIEAEVFEETPEELEAMERKEVAKAEIKEKIKSKDRGLRQIAKDVGREKREKFGRDLVLLPENIKRVGTKLVNEDIKNIADVSASKRRLDIVGSQTSQIKGMMSGKHPAIGDNKDYSESMDVHAGQPKVRISRYRGNTKRITDMGIGSSKGFADLSGLDRISGRKRKQVRDTGKESEISMEEFR